MISEERAAERVVIYETAKAICTSINKDDCAGKPFTVLGLGWVCSKTVEGFDGLDDIRKL